MGSAFELLSSDSVHIREQAKIDAGRITQKARNELKGAMAASNSWMQSFNNQKRLKAAGKSIDDITANIGRNLDAATTGRFSTRLAAAEEVGANVAAAAAAGVGGSSVETFNKTLRINQARQEELEDRGLRTDLLANTALKGSTLTGAVEGLDNQSFQAGLDYTQFVDHVKVTGLQKVVGFAAAAAASYFGGPQAGSAVLDLVSANNRAANGDFDGAAARAESAFTSGLTGLKTYTTAGNTPYGRDIWNSVKSRYGPRLNIGG